MTWTIEVAGRRAGEPHIRVGRRYTVNVDRYHEAADAARRYARMAGIVDVLIIGAQLERAPVRCAR